MAWTAATILGCRDPQATAEWFRDVLGFDLPPGSLFGGVGDEGVVYAVVHRDGVSVHLQIRRLDLPADREGIESDCYLYVDDVDALHDELVAAGAPIFRGLTDEPYGLRDFCVLTPDGHRLVLGSPLA